MRRLQNRRRPAQLLATALCVAMAAPALAQSGSGTRAAPPAPAAAPAQGDAFVDGIAAVVNKDVITLREVDKRAVQATQELTQRGIQVPDRDTLRHQVLQRLIMERLESQEADRLGIRVDDAQIDQAITMIATRNRITPQQLRAEVEKTGVTWDEYRRSLREDIRTDRLRQRTVDAHIMISDAEVDAFLKDQARNPAGAGASAGVALAAQPATAGQAGPVALALAQILVRVPEGASSSEVAALRKKAEDLLARLRNGDDFASLAASSSDGPEALQGGMMGARPLDGWPDLFVQAVASLQSGQVSDVIRSGNGFHILKVVERTGGQPAQPPAAPAQAGGAFGAPAMPAEQGPVRVTQTHARHILIKTSAVMTEDQARQRLEQVRQRLVSGGTDFASMARQYSQDATAPQGGDLGWVNPGDMVPTFESAMNALQPGEISQPITTPFGVHLIQVVERREQDVSDEVQRMRARQILFERRAQPAFEDWLETLRSQAYIDNRLEKQERLEQRYR
ncbi:peptidylprolyl isomerase [Bordetella sp. 2513F-2]